MSDRPTQATAAPGPEGQSNGRATLGEPLPPDARPDRSERTVASAPAARTDRTGAERQPPRRLVRLVACPACHARPGDPCVGRRGPRVAHHMARVNRTAVLDRRTLAVADRDDLADAS